MDNETMKAQFGNQKHLLRYWDELNELQKLKLLRQFKSYDFDQAAKWFQDSKTSMTDGTMEPIEAERHADSCKLSKEKLDEYWKLGLKAIADGKVAALVLAGGQASRLGVNKPKGTTPLGLHECDSLFTLQLYSFVRLHQLARQAFPGSKGKVNWYVMTSRATHEDTLRHLEALTNYLPAKALDIPTVITFVQDDIPCYDEDGKWILGEKGKIATAPNGNGGIYTAIEPHLEEMRGKGIEYIHVYCVDNILCRVADPHFIGYCIAKEADCACKVVEKTDPNENVGVFSRRNGQVSLVEYSEIDAELARKRDSEGRLVFRAGNIANHFFTLKYLTKVCAMDMQLPWHRAHKKIPYASELGVVKPSKPNGIKLEKFITDGFKFSKNFHLWQVRRESEFSPLKNPESVGKDCLSTCKRDLYEEHKRWLREAGAKLEETDGPNSWNRREILIHPLCSYRGEGLEEFKGAHIVLNDAFALKVALVVGNNSLNKFTRN